MEHIEGISAKFLEMFMHSTKSHAILKDARSGKCLDINQSHLEVYGLSTARDMMGFTVWDVNSFMNKMWLDNAIQVEKFDEEVLYNKTPLIKPMRVWLNSKGYVWAHHMGKYPIMNPKNKVIAILGTSEDLTNQLDLEELYQYYRHFYKQNKTAVSMFLSHINILRYFAELPTDAETRALVAKRKFIHNKLIAQYLKITEGTVEIYINRLTNKLNNQAYSLKDVIYRINSK